jgi:hypothetical protein
MHKVYIHFLYRYKVKVEVGQPKAMTDAARQQLFRDRQKLTPEMKKVFNQKEAARKARDRSKNKAATTEIRSDNDLSEIFISIFIVILKEDLAPGQTQIETAKQILDIIDN